VSIVWGNTESPPHLPTPHVPPQHDQNVTVMQQASLWQVHILYRQKQILKCTTELSLEQALCSCMHQITTQTTAHFCCMLLLISQDLIKFQNMLKS
jgi:hypothetical protein